MAGHPPEEMQGIVRDYRESFARLLEGQGFDCVGYDVEHMAFPQSVQEADGWLITGSRHGAYEDHAFIPPLEDFIRTARAQDIPMVGICFGHQIIAQALGGKVEKFSGGWSVGPTAYDWQGETVVLNAWHQDQVVERPAGAQPLARSSFCENAALVYDRTIFTVQAHPEYEYDFIDGLARHRGPGVVPEAQLAALAPAATDNARLARMIGRFFRERVAA